MQTMATFSVLSRVIRTRIFIVAMISSGVGAFETASFDKINEESVMVDDEFEIPDHHQSAPHIPASKIFEENPIDSSREKTKASTFTIGSAFHDEDLGEFGELKMFSAVLPDVKLPTMEEISFEPVIGMPKCEDCPDVAKKALDSLDNLLEDFWPTLAPTLSPEMFSDEAVEDKTDSLVIEKGVEIKTEKQTASEGAMKEKPLQKSHNTSLIDETSSVESATAMGAEGEVFPEEKEAEGADISHEVEVEGADLSEKVDQVFEGMVTELREEEEVKNTPPHTNQTSFITSEESAEKGKKMMEDSDSFSTRPEAGPLLEEMKNITYVNNVEENDSGGVFLGETVADDEEYFDFATAKSTLFQEKNVDSHPLEAPNGNKTAKSMETPDSVNETAEDTMNSQAISDLQNESRSEIFIQNNDSNAPENGVSEDAHHANILKANQNNITTEIKIDTMATDDSSLAETPTLFQLNESFRHSLPDAREFLPSGKVHFGNDETLDKSSSTSQDDVTLEESSPLSPSDETLDKLSPRFPTASVLEQQFHEGKASFISEKTNLGSDGAPIGQLYGAKKPKTSNLPPNIETFDINSVFDMSLTELADAIEKFNEEMSEAFKKKQYKKGDDIHKIIKLLAKRTVLLRCGWTSSNVSSSLPMGSELKMEEYLVKCVEEDGSCLCHYLTLLPNGVLATFVRDTHDETVEESLTWSTEKKRGSKEADTPDANADQYLEASTSTFTLYLNPDKKALQVLKLSEDSGKIKKQIVWQKKLSTIEGEWDLQIEKDGSLKVNSIYGEEVLINKDFFLKRWQRKIVQKKWYKKSKMLYEKIAESLQEKELALQPIV